MIFYTIFNENNNINININVNVNEKAILLSNVVAYGLLDLGSTYLLVLSLFSNRSIYHYCSILIHGLHFCSGSALNFILCTAVSIGF